MSRLSSKEKFQLQREIDVQLADIQVKSEYGGYCSAADWRQRKKRRVGPCGCCNLKLQKACKIVAIVEIFLGALAIAAGVFCSVESNRIAKAFAKKARETYMENKHNLNGYVEVPVDKLTQAILVFGITLTIENILKIPIGIVLFIGALKQNRSLCLKYIILRLTLGFFLFFRVLVPTLISVREMQIFFIGLIYDVAVPFYFFFVVGGYLYELKVRAKYEAEIIALEEARGQSAQEDLADLTAEEIVMGVYKPKTKANPVYSSTLVAEPVRSNISLSEGQEKQKGQEKTESRKLNYSSYNQ